MVERLDLRRALEERVVLLDGGMGTQLIEGGLRPGEAPEAFTLSRFEYLVEIHVRFLEAGADVIQTNTFGASRLKLPAGLAVAEVNERAVDAARCALEASKRIGPQVDASDRLGPQVGASDRLGPLVGGEIGPTGRFFPPVGDLDPADARDAFREQAEALERGGVDLFLVETMVDLREAALAVRAVREVTAKPILASLTFDLKPRGYFTMMGDPPAAVTALLDEGADAVGANCSLDPEEMVGLVREMREGIDAPLVFQPNASKPAAPGTDAPTAPNEYDSVLRTSRLGAQRTPQIDSPDRSAAGDAAGGARSHPATNEYDSVPCSYVERMGRIVAAGANGVGGCCGTDPRHIRALREHLDGGRA